MLQHLFDRRDYRLDLRDRSLFQMGGIVDRNLGAADPRKGRIKVIERILGQPHPDFSRQTATAPSFIHDQRAVGFGH